MDIYVSASAQLDHSRDPPGHIRKARTHQVIPAQAGTSVTLSCIANRGPRLRGDDTVVVEK